ncbi:MAG TPA: hypothetical protein VD902_05265, partial [Symbiobacteriaceae bacterium]|nr:hypothetical protein [Symbiobacteriaceae bacterium]
MTIACLTQLYTPDGLLRDAGRDGQPDGFAVRFVVGYTPGAVDVAARLGLESAAFTPGFTDPDAPGIPLYFGPDNDACPALPVEIPDGCGLVALIPGGVVVTGDSPETGWDSARWLAATFPFAAPGGPLLGEMAGGRAVQAVVVRNGAVAEVVYGEGPGVARDKPTLTGEPEPPPFRAPAPGDLPPEGPGRLFTTGGLMGSSDSVRHDRAGWQVWVGEHITPGEIAGLCELAARTGVEATGLSFPLASPAPVYSGTRLLLTSKAPPAQWAEGNLAWAPDTLYIYGTPDQRAAALRCAAAEAGLVDGVHATLFTRRAALPETPVPEGEVIFDLALEQEWEVGRFWRAWQAALSELAPGISADVDLRLSEPLPVREALAEEMAAGLAAAGVTSARIRVLPAYKQGFHWLEEEVLPRLHALAPLERVTVTCTPFAAGSDALEMPIRWLQELSPADELLEGALGVPVRFDLAETPQPHIYQLTAFAAGGAVALAEGFSPVCSARLYLPEFPDRGRVHPPTGLLRVEQGGRTVAE